MSSTKRHAALITLESLWWWGASLGIWLLSLSAISTEELVVSTIAALPCGIIAVFARRAARNAWRFRSSWFRPALLVPLAIVTDTAQVFASLIRRDTGAFKMVHVADAAGDTPLARGRRAVVTFLGSVTPGSYVIDISPDPGVALIHVLTRGGPSVQEAATQ